MVCVGEHDGVMTYNADRNGVSLNGNSVSWDKFLNRCYVKTETRCKELYDEGPKQSLDKCIRDLVHNQKNLEALCENRSISICDSEGKTIRKKDIIK